MTGVREADHGLSDLEKGERRGVARSREKRRIRDRALGVGDQRVVCVGASRISERFSSRMHWTIVRAGRGSLESVGIKPHARRPYVRS